MARRTFFGWLRLGILLTILLALVALNAWFDRDLTRDWDLPLRVTIYPIAQGDEDVACVYANRVSMVRRLRWRLDASSRLGGRSAWHPKSRNPCRIGCRTLRVSPPPALAERSGTDFYCALESADALLGVFAWLETTHCPTPDIQIFAIYQPSVSRDVPPCRIPWD